MMGIVILFLGKILKARIPYNALQRWIFFVEDGVAKGIYSVADTMFSPVQSLKNVGNPMRFMSKKIIAVALIVVVIALYGGFTIYASNAAKKAVDEKIADISEYADVTYKNVSVDLFGSDMHISDVLVSPIMFEQEIQINEIVIRDVDQTSGIPSHLNLSLNGIDTSDMEIDALKQAFGVNPVEYLSTLGYDDLLLNFAIKYHYDHDNKVLNYTLHLGADDVGKLDVSMKLGHVNLSEKGIMRLFRTYPKLKLYNAKISYHDDSLIEKVYEAMAEKEDETAEELKDDVMKKLDLAIDKERNKMAKNFLEETKAVIEDPESISISIEPDSPISFGRLSRMFASTGNNHNAMMRIMKRLNLKIEQ